MKKIDAVYYNKNERVKERKADVYIKKYSKDPVHHPMLLEREYVRALNATKMERMFAKPFVAALSQNTEGINLLVKDPAAHTFATASYDNKVSVWDLTARKLVNTISFDDSISSIAMDTSNQIYAAQGRTVVGPHLVYKSDARVNSIDIAGDLAVGTGNGISIFDVERETPKNHFMVDDVQKVKYNSSFKAIMGGITSLSIKLFDNRTCKDFAEINCAGAHVMDFNPQQGFLLAAGNDDGNSYSYDIRNLEKPLNTFRGHANAVVSLAFSPNGKEIATGSYDKTIRFFNLKDRKSRDCYYNDRMQIVNGVAYSSDARYVVSGSDDGCLRLWKAEASAKSKPMSRAEKDSLKYKEALKEKFKNIGEISRISKHRFLPHELKMKMKTEHEKYEARQRKEEKIEKAKNEKTDDDEILL
ncbi:DDB1- and CUL4-associated factor 13 [Enteropsectra breve]|nr:DDB1- and CUL4-associated factor 13 [Enteropsectra breve]